MMKFLITGCKGQVGFQLLKQLSGKADVLALDRDELDITDKKAVFQTVSEWQPDVIVNAAAHTAVDRAESEPELAHAINCVGAENLALAANAINAVILHISTDYVFDGTKSEPYIETDSVNPQSVYGKTKLDGEIAVANANPRHIILRTAWVFGEHGNNFVKTMLRLAQSRDELGIVADQFGAPTYAGDIAKALIRIAFTILEGSKAYGVYHFSGSPYVNWAEFAKEIFAQATLQNLIKKAPHINTISTADYPTPAKRPANSRLDLSKIKATFGIDPSDWRKALNNIQAYVA
ncbi:dTDP-4-dehydrorhamnose reductase [Lonepinella sp. BR2919]|uniref:dTDP-4-dehydrorhamnose reductase n=1 Tax=unclassified Lonepinella TaxID=2642006 RepID=UPI003F6E2A28